MQFCGELIGPVRDENDNGIGIIRLIIDPDRNDGYAFFRESPNKAHETRVLLTSVSESNDSMVKLSLRRGEYHENQFGIPDEFRLPSDFSGYVDLQKTTPNSFSGKWVVGSRSGQLRLQRVGLGEPTTPNRRFQTWLEFKAWADRVADGNAVFRGQVRNYRLTTSFHRTGRVDLVRYLRHDLPLFVDYLETIQGSRFDLERAPDVGAVIGLAQHYGFPTPLLDWTASPYVAAYFAFAEAVESATPNEYVRIFRISGDFVSSGMSQPAVNIIDKNYTVTMFRPPSRGNSRLLRQQGLFLASTLIDIEDDFRKREARMGLAVGEILEIVDVRSDQARVALADLRHMGTTAATLFEGLDGAAKQLKHTLFYPPKQEA